MPNWESTIRSPRRKKKVLREKSESAHSVRPSHLQHFHFSPPPNLLLLHQKTVPHHQNCCFIHNIDSQLHRHSARVTFRLTRIVGLRRLKSLLLVIRSFRSFCKILHLSRNGALSTFAFIKRPSSTALGHTSSKSDDELLFTSLISP